MFSRLFKQWKWKRLARQLRRPTGNAGKETGILMNRSNHYMYQFTLEQMQLKDGDQVLEIGFGNGHFFPQVLSAAENLSLYGIDYSRLMVEETRRANSNLIQNGQLQLVNGNSNALPYPDQYFDVIFCINVIYFWDQPEDHLKEIRRVLKTGGRFFATCRSKENMALMPFTRWNFKPYTADEWETELKKNKLTPFLKESAIEAGFQDLQLPIEPRQWCVGATRSD